MYSIYEAYKLIVMNHIITKFLITLNFFFIVIIVFNYVKNILQGLIIFMLKVNFLNLVIK